MEVPDLTVPEQQAGVVDRTVRLPQFVGIPQRRVPLSPVPADGFMEDFVLDPAPGVPVFEGIGTETAETEMIISAGLSQDFQVKPGQAVETAMVGEFVAERTLEGSFRQSSFDTEIVTGSRPADETQI